MVSYTYDASGSAVIPGVDGGDAVVYNPGDIAWVLTSTALVMIMVGYWDSSASQFAENLYMLQMTDTGCLAILLRLVAAEERAIDAGAGHVRVCLDKLPMVSAKPSRLEADLMWFPAAGSSGATL